MVEKKNENLKAYEWILGGNEMKWINGIKLKKWNGY